MAVGRRYRQCRSRSIGGPTVYWGGGQNWQQMGSPARHRAAAHHSSPGIIQLIRTRGTYGTTCHVAIFHLNSIGAAPPPAHSLSQGQINSGPITGNWSDDGWSTGSEGPYRPEINLGEVWPRQATLRRTQTDGSTTATLLGGRQKAAAADGRHIALAGDTAPAKPAEYLPTTCTFNFRGVSFESRPISAPPILYEVRDACDKGRRRSDSQSARNDRTFGKRSEAVRRL